MSNPLSVLLICCACVHMMLLFFLCKVLSIREVLLIIIKSFSFVIISSSMEFSWIEFIDFTTFFFGEDVIDRSTT